MMELFLLHSVSGHYVLLLENITLIGIGDDDIKITVDEIKKLKIINKDVISLSSGGEETKMNVTGGLLEELLNKRGISQAELSGIRVTAIDGYSMEIPSEVLKNRDIILAYEINGKPLFEENRPIRIIVPGERAMYWVGAVSTIGVAEEEKITTSGQSRKVLIFDTAISNLDKQDYEHHEDLDEVIKIKDLLNKFVPEGEKQVLIRAADGLQRNETRETFENAFIKITGRNSPMFLFPDLPKGMYVKDLLWFNSEKVAFLIMDKALKTYGRLFQEDFKGISLKEVLEDIGLKQGDIYTFTADNGYCTEISKDDIDKGMLYKAGNGSAGVNFKGLARNTAINNLLSIEVK